MRGPGEELKNLGAAIKNPVGGFGVLAGAARRRWRQTWPPRELAGISHEWRAEASEALEASRDFAVVAREAVWRHRQRIVDAQLVLAPLADAASHLFLQWTALAHLSSDVVAHPPRRSRGSLCAAFSADSGGRSRNSGAPMRLSWRGRLAICDP